MAGSLKHKARSQYSYHQNAPFSRFYVNAARIKEQKESRAQGNFISRFLNNVRKMLDK